MKVKTLALKKVFVALMAVLMLLCLFAEKKQTTWAQNIVETNYAVFDKQQNFLFERISVQVGDIYIDKNFNKYQVYLVDQAAKTAKARFVEQLKRPNITKRDKQPIDVMPNKKIGLYLTHNAESYIIGDGTDSFYGKGGVHDIANLFANELRKKQIDATLLETLHLPHDSGAYTRSRVTAKNLLSAKPDALFDIHRDGVSRGTYAKVTNGKEHSTVRIVVGQANPNQAKNLAFATWLVSVADVLYPWLFLDIYFARGHYNQDLFEKSLLFEMGTYTIEKQLVEATVKPLADVVYTTLYSTVVDKEGDLTINGESSPDSKTVNQALSGDRATSYSHFSSAAAVLVLVGFTFAFLFKWRQKIKHNNQP